MLFDKNKYRLKELERRIEKGNGNPDKIRNLIESVRQKPNWWVKYTDRFGKVRFLKVPERISAKRELERFERKVRVDSNEGTLQHSDKIKARLSDILDYYLNEKAKKSKSYSAAKTLCNHLKQHLGYLRLSVLNDDPEPLHAHFQNFPERDWSMKYRYNSFIILRAAINYWLKKNRILMFNPAKSVELDRGTNVREYAPSIAEYQHVLEVAMDKKNGFEDFTPRLLIARWETGLRIGEIIQWKWEEIDLEHAPQGELPYFTTYITKQRRTTKKQIPMSFPLWKMLKAIPGQHETGFVFKRPSGVPFSAPPFEEFTRLKKVAEITWEFHDFRKSRKTALKSAGFSKELTKAFQGHATDSMDEYYTVFGRYELEPLVKDSWKEFDEKVTGAS